MTKRKVEDICFFNRGDFKIEDGWFWVPDEHMMQHPVNPLAPLIGPIWRQKESSSGLEREVTKRIMSGIWGMLLQVTQDKGFGDMFNPCWGAEVETNIALETMKFILLNRIDPIHVSVDGVTSPTRVGIEIIEGKQSEGMTMTQMGKWQLASAAPTLCAGTAAMAIQGRSRTADFSVDYDWLRRCIEAVPEASEYKMSKLSPVTLAVALNTDFSKLGELRTITKKVYAEADLKRYYREAPACGKDLLNRTYNSEPWDVSMLSNPTQEL